MGLSWEDYSFGKMELGFCCGKIWILPRKHLQASPGGSKEGHGFFLGMIYVSSREGFVFYLEEDRLYLGRLFILSKEDLGFIYVRPGKNSCRIM